VLVRYKSLRVTDGDAALDETRLQLHLATAVVPDTHAGLALVHEYADHTTRTAERPQKPSLPSKLWPAE
jgi:hypothetical protein